MGAAVRLPGSGVHFSGDARADADRARRRVLYCTGAVAAPLGLLVALLWAAALSRPLNSFYWGALAVCGAGAIGLCIACVASLPLQAGVEGVLGVALLGVLLIDWTLATEAGSVRMLSTAMLVLDGCVAARARGWVRQVCLHTVALWLVVTAIEDAFRLGLYDVREWAEADRGRFQDYADCVDPPCERPAGDCFAGAVLLVAGLYLNYFVVAGFAASARAERASVLAALRFTDQLFVHLSRFDLTAAREALAEAAEAQEQDEAASALCASFAALVEALAVYRPYLPQSCFEEMDKEEEALQAYDQREGWVLWGGDRDSSDGEACSNRPDEAKSTAMTATSSGPGSVLHHRGGSHRASTAGTEHSHAFSRGEDSSPASSKTGRRCPLERRSSHAAHQRRITAVACNRCNFLVTMRERAPTLATWVAAEVEAFCIIVQSQKGMVDLLSGDHCYALFGALKVQGSHRQAGVYCASKFTGLVPSAMAPASRYQGDYNLTHLDLDDLPELVASQVLANNCLSASQAPGAPPQKRRSPDAKSGGANSAFSRKGSRRRLRSLDASGSSRGLGSKISSIDGSTTHAPSLMSGSMTVPTTGQLAFAPLNSMQRTTSQSSHTASRSAPSTCNPPSYLAEVVTSIATSEDPTMRPTSAVCSGSALCGDFGSHTLQRFMVIGGVMPWTTMLERVAAEWRCLVLVDSMTHADLQFAWDSVLRKSVIYPKRGTERPSNIWEVAGPKQPLPTTEEATEWMYALHATRPNPWDGYNEAVMKWLTGHPAEALASIASARVRENPPAVREALRALDHALHVDGANPPLATLNAAASAGDPAPLIVRHAAAASQPTPPMPTQPRGSPGGSPRPEMSSPREFIANSAGGGRGTLPGVVPPILQRAAQSFAGGDEILAPGGPQWGSDSSGSPTSETRQPAAGGGAS